MCLLPDGNWVLYYYYDDQHCRRRRRRQLNSCCFCGCSGDWQTHHSHHPGEQHSQVGYRVLKNDKNKQCTKSCLHLYFTIKW